MFAICFGCQKLCKPARIIRVLAHKGYPLCERCLKEYGEMDTYLAGKICTICGSIENVGTQSTGSGTPVVICMECAEFQGV